MSEKLKPIQKLFIAQRGEIAYRAARTCEVRGISAVIADTFADLNPLASELVVANLDRGWELAHLGGTSQEENFTNPKVLIETMKLHNCDAVFLGYGFLSERADFVRQCEEVGIRVLAPPSAVMEKTGNKINAREFARRVRFGRLAHIPILEGTQDLQSYEQAVISSQELNFPLMLKDPDLGGGVGNIVVRNEQELERAYTALKARPENIAVFMERFIQNPVHVEVQIVADQYGNIVALGERDCTLQRKGQKVVEESPSPHISDRLRQVLQNAAVRFARDVKFIGVGTWEFLIDLDRKGRAGDPAWYFMEINPRIQVEHPVTEMQTGLDIVGLMIDIAEGRALPFKQKDIQPDGHTIEARVYAESPERNFERSAGVITTLRYPDIEGVRIDPALREGDSLSFWYDHTIFKAIAHGADRETARERLIRLLSGTAIIGASNNLHFLTELLSTEEFSRGRVTTNFVEKWWGQRLKDRVHAKSEFINGGTLTPIVPSAEYNPKLLPLTSTVIRRDSSREISYQDHINRIIKEKGTACAAEYGIQERDGVRWVLYSLDFSINAGVFGPQEGNVFVDACKLAHQEGLVLITLVSTGGIDQWTNTLALHQMTRSVATVKTRYPPKLHINVYHGLAYGGVPASFGGAADIQIMVDAEDSKLGFSGIYLVARQLGVVLPENTRAAKVYQELAEFDEKFKGIHSTTRHYQDRNVDYVAGSLSDASDKVAHLIHNLGGEESITDPNRIFEPKEQIALREGSAETTRFDRPGIFLPVWFSPISRLRERMIRSRVAPSSAQTEPLTNYERWKIIYEVIRPTAVDLLDTRFGLFDDTVLLSGPTFHFEEDEYYPPIIAAIARIEDIRLLVLAQQTQRVKDEITANMIKRYNAQKPVDWEYAERVISGIGLKNKLPIFTIADTEGADCSPEAESAGQSRKIQRIIDLRYQYPYTSLALLLGLKGSGGGETFFSPADGAAAAENSLAFVADPRTKSWIQGGHWLDDKSEEFKRFINGETTARAEVLKTMGLVDVVIKEGPGGAHRNILLFAKGIRSWLFSELRRDMLLSVNEREEKRWERSEKPSVLFNA